MNLFDVTRGLPVPCNDKPRTATDVEVREYLFNLARRHGFTIGVQAVRGKAVIAGRNEPWPGPQPMPDF